jgi:hypothetical protein
MELEQQAVIVEARQKDYEDDARVAKDSKKAWDEAEEKFTKMALEFRRRRQAKDDPIDAPDTAARSPRLVKCTWEAKHADERCPLCNEDEPISPMVLEEIYGNIDKLPPADAEAHVDKVDLFLIRLEVRETLEALEAIDTFIPDRVITDWTSEERKAVTLYADQQLDLKNGLEPMVESDRLDRPTVLGRPHIPARVDADGVQVCTICTVRIPREANDDPYRESDLVGVDCAGKAPKATGPDHHYPDTGKKKAPAKGAKAKTKK